MEGKKKKKIYSEHRAAKYSVCPGTAAPFDNKMLLPVDTLFLSFITSIEFVAHHEADRSIPSPEIQMKVDELNVALDPLLQGLEATTSRFRDIFEGNVKSNIVWCSLISIAAILVCIYNPMRIGVVRLIQKKTKKEKKKNPVHNS